MAVQKLSPHHEIMGTDAKDLNAGWTRASPLKFSPQDSVPREGDVFGRPHDVYKLIFFTPDQIGLLNMSSKFVVFFNDYGSGKTCNHFVAEIYYFHYKGKLISIHIDFLFYIYAFQVKAYSVRKGRFA